jgi:hypothetical protein
MATYSSKKYPAGSVTSATLADGTVAAVDLAAGSVGTTQLADTAVTNGKLAADGFDASKFTTGTLPIARVADGAVTTAKLADGSVTPAKLPNAGAELGMRNRIINGDMRIDQRNAGASVTPSADSTFTLDRWIVRNAGGTGRFSIVRSSTSAANFPNSALLTVTTTAVPSSNEFYSLEQIIEGYNISDFGWGTANAKDITISFQVRSSLTGTYCVVVRNSTAERSFVSEFTINSANTFETKTITVPGETSGTWNTTNNAGLLLDFCLGVASSREGTAGSWQTTNIVGTSNQVDWINTSGATFYITGVQLEVGSVATPFERRPYGTELSLCQRYFVKIAGGASDQIIGNAYYNTSTNVGSVIKFPTTMRSAPTVTVVTGTNYFTTANGDTFNSLSQAYGTTE